MGSKACVKILPREYSTSLSFVQTGAPCDFQLEAASIIYQVSAAFQSPTIQFFYKKQELISRPLSLKRSCNREEITVSNFAGSKLCIGGQEPNILCVSWSAGCTTGSSESISWIKGCGQLSGFLGPLASDVRAKPINSLLSHGWCNSSVILYAEFLSEQWMLTWKMQVQIEHGWEDLVRNHPG